MSEEFVVLSFVVWLCCAAIVWWKFGTKAATDGSISPALVFAIFALLLSGFGILYVSLVNHGVLQMLNTVAAL